MRRITRLSGVSRTCLTLQRPGLSVRLMARTPTKGPLPDNPVAGENKHATATTEPTKPAKREVEVKGKGNAVPFNFRVAKEKLPVQFGTPSGDVATYIYAQAEHAGGAERVDRVFKQLKTLYNGVVRYPDLWNYMTNEWRTQRAPPKPQQQKALLESLAKTLKIDADVTTYAKGIVELKMFPNFRKILQDLRALINARDEVVTLNVTVTSADQPLPNNNTIHKLFGHSQRTKYASTLVVDPSLGGGITIATDDKVADFSFKDELNKLDSTLQRAYLSAKTKRREAVYSVINTLEKHFNIA